MAQPRAGAAAPTASSSRARASGGKTKPRSSSKPRLISQAAYARHRGVTRNAVSVAASDGRIRLIDGLVDPTQADRDWKANTDPVKQVRKAAPHANGHARPEQDRSSLLLHKETQRVNLQMRQLELAKELELVVAAEPFEKAYRERVKKALKMLLVLDARIAPQVARGPDVAECKRIIRHEVELIIRAIAEISDGELPEEVRQ